MEQVNFRQALSCSSSGNGRYTFSFPQSLCYGVGGVVMAAIHKAAVDLIKSSVKSTHVDLLSINLQFFRPTLASPQEAIIEVRVDNISRVATTVHVQVTQQKLCLSGYVITVEMIEMDWKLIPSPLPTSVESLESDKDPMWAGYRCPLKQAGFRPAHSYIEYHIPKTQPYLHMADQWVTPGWIDDGLPNGPVWTDELVHFVIDNGLPLFLDREENRTYHEEITRVALEQRKARTEERSDEFAARDMGVSRTLASLSIATHFHKSLPTGGVKWLFMRSTTKGILNNRMDHDMVVMDEMGDVIATSHHVVQVIRLENKKQKL